MDGLKCKLTRTSSKLLIQLPSISPKFPILESLPNFCENYRIDDGCNATKFSSVLHWVNNHACYINFKQCFKFSFINLLHTEKCEGPTKEKLDGSKVNISDMINFTQGKLHTISCLHSFGHFLTQNHGDQLLLPEWCSGGRSPARHEPPIGEEGEAVQLGISCFQYGEPGGHFAIATWIIGQGHSCTRAQFVEIKQTHRNTYYRNKSLLQFFLKKQTDLAL